ncbi:flagellar motor protein MotB [Hyphococcus flavus]|uniref:Flagellar motor protein MotB n=1 Tax=Hyphococcus flavus TaxID=1866326 RepID=A0AAF0CBP7_9PROT|nr:flagellar motor protein MotB [Hyphococcus flavus]WDI31525.1 flagellar motor protein MotB [Hyphococcus flavus]
MIAGGGHHGGAWKVAYADFVTAMMAFFLLMWLLNATTEDQRKGLADYFNPSIPISKVSGGGSGALNGSSVFTDEQLSRDGTGAVREYPNSREIPVNGPENSMDAPLEGKGVDNELGSADAENLESVQSAIDSESLNAFEGDLAKHIQTRMTPDGLVIELVDADGHPLYNAGSSNPSNTLYELLEVIAPVLATVSNNMAIVGHTDAHAFSTSANYTNWELSTDRALAARRLMIKNGIPLSQIVQVTGKADTEPFSDDPYAPQNRRIAITLLTKK